MMSSTNKLSVPQSNPYIYQVDNPPSDSQPDPIETLDVCPTTSTVHKEIYFK